MLDDTLCGLEVMQRLVASGGQAPLGKVLDFRIVEVGDGFAVFEGTPGEAHYNPAGIVHGGWTSSVLDSALGCAIHTQLSAGQGYSTIELKVNMVRAITAQTGLVRARGEVIHLGRRMATSDAKLVDADGKLLAHGSCTCMIL